MGGGILLNENIKTEVVGNELKPKSLGNEPLNEKNAKSDIK